MTDSVIFFVTRNSELSIDLVKKYRIRIHEKLGSGLGAKKAKVPGPDGSGLRTPRGRNILQAFTGTGNYIT
jgi:hypothetical protein